MIKYVDIPETAASATPEPVPTSAPVDLQSTPEMASSEKPKVKKPSKAAPKAR